MWNKLLELIGLQTVAFAAALEYGVCVRFAAATAIFDVVILQLLMFFKLIVLPNIRQLKQHWKRLNHFIILFFHCCKSESERKINGASIEWKNIPTIRALIVWIISTNWSTARSHHKNQYLLNES